MLVITRRQGEAFLIGDNIEIIISEISGDKIKVSINAPREIPIVRRELLEISDANRDASRTVEKETLGMLAESMERYFSDKP